MMVISILRLYLLHILSSAPQFFRCLWQTLGIKLNPEEEQLVRQKYDIKGTGEINYKAFCSEVDKGFNAGDLLRDPISQKVEPPEL